MHLKDPKTTTALKLSSLSLDPVLIYAVYAASRPVHYGSQNVYIPTG